MQLKPAIKMDGQIVTGRPNDSHGSMIEEKGLKGIEESHKGFTPDGRLFLTRRAAMGWLKQYEPGVYEKVKDDSKEEGLHSGNYARIKGIEQVKVKVDLSKKHFIVFDRGGLYTYFAQKLGESVGRVDYYIPDAEAYPESSRAAIGKGLPEIRRITDKEFHKNIDKADMIAFPDCYDGAKQHWLRSKGYRVFGSGLSERFEIDKEYFLEAIHKAGLLVPKTYRAEGIDDLIQYLKTRKSPLWLKGLMRGDFETKKYSGMKQFMNWLNHDLLPRIGQKSKDIEILVQDPVESDCESGADRLVADGKFTKEGTAGFEDKDKSYVCKFFDELPEILTAVDDVTASELKDSRCHHSTEIRLNEQGAWYTDSTERIPSPPGGVMMEMIDDYPEKVWEISGGQVPKLSATKKYGVELILTSAFYEKHEICIEFPEKFDKNIKLKNHTKRDGSFYCIPNGNGVFFGSIVVIGDDWRKAAEEAQAIAEEIECEDLEYSKETFKKAEETIKKGKEYGIEI